MSVRSSQQPYAAARRACEVAQAELAKGLELESAVALIMTCHIVDKQNYVCAAVVAGGDVAKAILCMEVHVSCACQVDAPRHTWPAVSQIWSLQTRPSTLIVLISKSTPMVV